MNDSTNSSDESAVNPYAAPTTASTTDLNKTQQLAPPPEPSKVIFKWLIVCSVAAGPSFYFGGGIGDWRGPEVFGMVMGILIFVAGYCLIEFMPQIRSAMAQRAKRRATRIAYITRMGISILFPVGLVIDLYCGIVSVGLSNAITGVDWKLGRSNASDPSIIRFLTFLLTTLIQGTLLNILLFTYMLLVYGFLRLIGVDDTSSVSAEPTEDQ